MTVEQLQNRYEYERGILVNSLLRRIIDLEAQQVTLAGDLKELRHLVDGFGQGKPEKDRTA